MKLSLPAKLNLLTLLTGILLIGSMIHYHSTHFNAFTAQDCTEIAKYADCTPTSTTNSDLLLYASIAITSAIVIADVAYFVKLRKLPKYSNAKLPTFFKLVDMGIMGAIVALFVGAKLIQPSYGASFFSGAITIGLMLVGFIVTAGLTGLIIGRRETKAK